MIFKDPTDQKTLRAKILKDLTTTMASIRGVPIDFINITAPWWASIKGQAPAPPKSILSDPSFNKWQGAMLDVLSRYLLMMDTKAPALPCPSGGDASTTSPAAAAARVSAKAVLAAELPLAQCTNRTPEALMQQVGFSSQLVSGWVASHVTQCDIELEPRWNAAHALSAAMHSSCDTAESPPFKHGGMTYSGTSGDHTDHQLTRQPSRLTHALYVCVQIGRHSTPFNPLTTIADGIMVYGLCTVPDRDGYNSYGDFMLGRCGFGFVLEGW
jgi:hypothetical protein